MVAKLIMTLDKVDVGTGIRWRCGHCALNHAGLEDSSQERQALAMQGVLGRQHKIIANLRQERLTSEGNVDAYVYLLVIRMLIYSRTLCTCHDRRHSARTGPR